MCLSVCLCVCVNMSVFNIHIVTRSVLCSAFLGTKSFPQHILRLRDIMKEQEEVERQQKERDRSVCKVSAFLTCCIWLHGWDFSVFQVKLFCRHPTEHKLLDARLEVHKDKTLADATEIAYKVCYHDICLFTGQSVYSFRSCCSFWYLSISLPIVCLSLWVFQCVVLSPLLPSMIF